MRLFIFPLFAIGLAVGVSNDQPSQAQMRGAFERALGERVASALEHVSETDGSEAVERLRALHRDRFVIRDFRKQECRRSSDGRGHICQFEADVMVSSGQFTARTRGRFLAGPQGLVFAEEV
jgi:hypothetical protein